MVIFSIFFLHFVYIVYIFIKKYKSSGLSDAIMNVVFIIVIFSIGWSILNLLLKPILPEKIHFEELSSDSIILIILSAIEYIGYRKFYGNTFTSNEKGR